MKRKINSAVVVRVLILFSLLTVAATAIVYANKYAKTSADQQIQLQNKQAELKKVNNQLNEVEQEKKKKIEENDASKQQIEKLELEKKDLEQQLQAKIEQKSRLAAAAQAVTAKIASVVTPVAYAEGCGNDKFANYIYMHESGCRLNATNSEGCVGIGQACPASKLTAVCPNLDYSCQNAFFTNYAVTRYGSWEAAYNTWLTQRWW